MQNPASGSNIGSILDKTADLITSRGWMSGGGWWMGDETPDHQSLCLEGGLQCALGIPHSDTNRMKFLTHPVYVFLQQYLGLKAGQALYAWNDREVTHHTDVINLLRAAAKKARGEDDKLKKQAVKKSIKAITAAMNDEMAVFEASIQNDKELIHV